MPEHYYEELEETWWAFVVEHDKSSYADQGQDLLKLRNKRYPDGVFVFVDATDRIPSNTRLRLISYPVDRRGSRVDVLIEIDDHRPEYSARHNETLRDVRADYGYQN